MHRIVGIFGSKTCISNTPIPPRKGFKHFAYKNLSLYYEEELCDPFVNENDGIILFHIGFILNLTATKNNHEQGNKNKWLMDMYTKNKSQFVYKLDGAYLILLYDLKEKNLRCIADEHCLVSLYYQKLSGGMAFSTLVKDLRNLFDSKTEINIPGLIHRKKNGFYENNQTLINGVNLTTKYTIIEYDLKGGEITFYERKSNMENVTADTFSLDSIDHALGQGIRQRVNNVKNVCVLSSGGIDSSLNLCYLHRCFKGKVTAFTIFNDINDQEVNIAKHLCDEYGFEFIPVDFCFNDINRFLVKALLCSCDITYNGLGALLIKVSEHAKQLSPWIYSGSGPHDPRPQPRRAKCYEGMNINDMMYLECMQTKNNINYANKMSLGSGVKLHLPYFTKGVKEPLAFCKFFGDRNLRAELVRKKIKHKKLADIIIANSKLGLIDNVKHNHTLREKTNIFTRKVTDQLKCARTKGLNLSPLEAMCLDIIHKGLITKEIDEKMTLRDIYSIK